MHQVRHFEEDSLTKDARPIAAYIAKVPELLRL